MGRPGPPAAGTPPLDRRSFLALAAATGAGAVLAACGAGPGRAGPPATTAGGPTGGGPSPGSTAPGSTAPAGTAPAGTAPGSTAPGETVTAADWTELASALAGRLVVPTDPGYAADVELFDFRYDGTRPAAIAYCAGEADVARCVGFARQHGITPTPRAGGHSYGGYSTSPGLVVDVTPMAGVGPPAAGGTATIGAGARLIDVYSTLNAAGVSIPAGSCPTVGLTGLALGGGIGVVSRLHGLTADSVVSARVVTADARAVTASAEVNPDLYWALRGGGGGNFGIVTSWEFATFPTEAVAVFDLTWPWPAASSVVGAWQDWMAGAPDRAWSTCVLSAQAGGPGVRVGGVVVGGVNDAAALLARLRRTLGPPATSFLAGMPFATAMYVEAGCADLSEARCHLPGQTASGTLTRQPSMAKSALLTEALPAPAVAAVVAALEDRQAAGLAGAAAFDSLGGATGRAAPDATAWVHRDAVVSMQYSVPLTPGVPAAALAADRAWLAALAGVLAPSVSGQAYQNYIDPTLAGWADAYYGANLPRLAATRRRWDPDATFRFAQAVPLRV